jgi:hypothetical protein
MAMPAIGIPYDKRRELIIDGFLILKPCMKPASIRKNY